MIENLDSFVNIEAVGTGAVNFNVSMYVSSSTTTSRKRRSAPNDEGPFAASVNEDTSVGLATKSNMSLTGTVQITLSRQSCVDMKRICYVVSSGTGASYEVSGGQTILCADIDPYKNCHGMSVFSC